MFLKLNHQKPEVYTTSRQFVPDIANDLEYLIKIDIAILGGKMITCFKLLTDLIQPETKN